MARNTPLPQISTVSASRGVSAKRSLASREFALGIEALERFVASASSESSLLKASLSKLPAAAYFIQVSINQKLASDHKYLRIRDLCKEPGIVVCARILQRSGSGKPRPTLVWCLCAR